MNPLILGPVLEIGKTLLDRWIPDPEKKREAEMEMFRMAADGELKQVLAQLEINAREAQHPSLWVSGGRPFFLWIGGAGFGYAVLIQPMLAWIARIKGWPEPPLPDIDLLWVVVSGLLGLSGMRTAEKFKGVAAK